MPNQQRTFCDSPVRAQGNTIGATVGIVMRQWGVAMMYRTTGHNGPPPQRHKPTNECRRIVPSSPQPSPTIWGDQCGLNDRDWHTQTRRNHCSQEGRTTIGTCCVPGPRHRDAAAQTHWGQSTIWRGHNRPTTSPKEGKEGGHISKEFCANADLCPLASPRVALVGVCLLRHPDNGNTR